MSGWERLNYDTPLLRRRGTTFFRFRRLRISSGVNAGSLDGSWQPGLQYALGNRREFAELQSHPKMCMGIDDRSRRFKNLCFGVNLQANGSPAR